MLFSCILFCGFSQNKNDSVDILSEPITVNKYTYFIKYMNLKYLFYGQAGTFFECVKLPYVYLGNIETRLRSGYFPVFLDIHINISSSFTLSKIPDTYIDLYDLPGKNPIKMDNYDFILCYCPLPKIHYLSEFIVPYFGLGYSIANIWTTKYKSTLNFSSWKYKVGCNFFIPNCPLYFIIEYAQNLNIERNYKTLNLGMYMTFPYKNKKRTNILKYVE